MLSGLIIVVFVISQLFRIDTVLAGLIFVVLSEVSCSGLTPCWLVDFCCFVRSQLFRINTLLAGLIFVVLSDVNCSELTPC